MAYHSEAHGAVTHLSADILEASAAAYYAPLERQDRHVSRLEDKFVKLAAALGYSVEKIEPAVLEAAE